MQFLKHSLHCAQSRYCGINQEPPSGMSDHQTVLDLVEGSQMQGSQIQDSQDAMDPAVLDPVEGSQVQGSQIQDSQDAMDPGEVRKDNDRKRPAPAFGPQPAPKTTKLEGQPPAEYYGPWDWKVELPNLITAHLKELAQKMLADPDKNLTEPQVTITMPLRTFADNKAKRGRIAYHTDPDKVTEGGKILLGKQWAQGEYSFPVWTRKFKEGSSASSNGDRVEEGSS